MAVTHGARTLKLLRDQGYTAEIVERFNTFSHTRKDFCGFADILAFQVGENGVTAVNKARDMILWNYRDHTRPDHGAFHSEADRLGCRFEKIGENLAWNYFTPHDTYMALKMSSGHFANMTRPDMIITFLLTSEETHEDHRS